MITSKTNLDKVNILTKADIDTSDIPPLTEEFLSKSYWFQCQNDYEQEITLALKVYADLHTG